MQLQIGDKIADGSVVVHDEDRLCYQVYSTAKGVTGLRTISKALLDEWVSEVQAHPSYTSDQLRKALSGKTEIDKFEYGYASTLKKMAEMVLGIVPVIHSAPDFSEEFCKWFAANRGNGNDTTAKKYLAYFKTLTDAYQEPTHSYWHGLYKVMYGHDAEKEVAAIGEPKEFEKIYGAILPALEKKTVSGDLDSVGSQKAIDWFWQPEVKPHTCVTSALNAYRDFLKWRETQTTDADEKTSGDLISYAIQLFKARRKDEEWVAQLKRDGYGGLHARYRAMNVEEIRNYTPEQFDAWVEKELWAARTFFCGENLKKLSASDKAAFCAFIAATKKTPRLISSYLASDADLPTGIGPVIVTELLLKFHPQDFMGYNALMLQGLKAIGLVSSDKVPAKVTMVEYNRVAGPSGLILGKLIDAQVPRRFDEGEDATPDYITVNEFLWWCKEHREDILKGHWEKYMKTEIKKVEQQEIDDFSKFVEKLEKDVADCGLIYATGLMRRFVCAQLAKPFVVLTGLSGSGKTKLAQAFTDWIAVENTAKVVPVGADWTNSEKLLGYPNALDPDKYVLPDTGVLKLLIDASREENRDLPFFLILDEMNLSHVERYFADFLSTMESEDTIKLYDGKERFADDGTPVPPTLPWPKNLFVIGTMNVDETTYMFSPKVLDRAQVIEFRVEKDDIEKFLAAPKSPKMDELKEKGAAYAKAFLKLSEGRNDKKPADAELAVVKEALAGMFEELATLGSEFGFRSAVEIVNFIEYSLEACGYGELTDEAKKTCMTDAIDAAIVQKLLPKLHGSQQRLGPVLRKLKDLASKEEMESDGGEQKKVLKPRYKLTCEKLDRMLIRLKANGFTSFAEA